VTGEVLQLEQKMSRSKNEMIFSQNIGKHSQKIS
jgi:hypothetical protein